MTLKKLLGFWIFWITSYSPLALCEDVNALSDLSLEELMQVSVTAQRREQVWAEVPASLNVLTERRLAEQNIVNLSQVASAIPGYVYGRVGNVASSFVRGIGSSLFSISADASTAVYQDDVYLARPEMTLGYFWDMQRVELLKGPQGALYGRNATGGVINLVHRQAEFNQQQGQISAAAGAFNKRSLEGVINQPLGDAATARVSVFSIVDRGFTDDQDKSAGDIIDDQRVFGTRTQFAFKLNANWESRINVDYFQDNNHGFSIRPVDHLGLAETFGDYTPEDFHAVQNNNNSFSNYKTWGLDWRWKGNLGFAELQIISAYRKLDSEYLFNTDGTPALVTDSGFSNRENQTSHEIRLLSNTSGEYDWLVGFYSLHETPQLAVGLIRYPLNNSAIILAKACTDAQSMYGEFNWHFAPLWSTKLGLRSTHESRDDANYIFASGDLLGLQSPTLNQERPHSAEHDDSFSHLSPQLVLSKSQQTTDQSTTSYLSITEGFKSGGSNSLSAADSFDPEVVLSYEIGHKHVEGGSSWSLSSFYYNYDDLQVLAFENGVTAINNAAAAKIWGIEGSFSVSPVTSFSYQLNAAWLQARYQEFISSIDGKPVDVSGNQMPYAPRWDINQKFTYTGLLKQKTLTLNLFHHYQSQTTYNQFEDPNVTQGALHIFDVVAEWDVANDWVLSAGIYNLTNEEYFRNIVTFTTTSKPNAPQGNALGYPEPGRSWDVGARMRF